jgi:putative drug exporter of the RND superfamily
MFDRLGWIVLRLRYVFVIGWLVAAAGFGALAPSLSKAGSADETSFLPRDAESLAARGVIATSFPGDSAPTVALIVFSRQGGLTDADRLAIEGLRGYFEGAGHPGGVLRYVTAESTPTLASMLRSGDNVVELTRLDLSTPSFLPSTNATVDAIRAHLAQSGSLPKGLSAQITGQAGIGRDYLKAIQDGTDRTTIVTIVLVILVLLLIYRAPLAALAPLITIGSAFMVARGVLGFLAQGGWQLSSVLDSFIVVLVFGVGTDYSIFFISRFREELRRNERDGALRVTVKRIGAVIAASAATVMVGLASMAAARFGMIQTTGPALAIAIFVTLLAGLTLTPSLLAIFGRRLFWPHPEVATYEVTVVAVDEATAGATAPDATTPGPNTPAPTPPPVAASNRGDDERGIWAALAHRITTRPGAVSGIVLIFLVVPALWLPALKQNFDVLNELPAGVESRQGFETLSRHLGAGQLMPVTVLLKVPASGKAWSTSDQLSAIAAIERRVKDLSDVRSVSSVVDPTGLGIVSDTVRPKAQLSKAATALDGAPATDMNVLLSDSSLGLVKSTAGYVAGLAAAYPSRDNLDFAAATTDLNLLSAAIVAGRQQALVANQLDAITAQLASLTPGSESQAAEIQNLKIYLESLGAALPDVAAEASYQSALTAVNSLAGGPTLAAYNGLKSAIADLSAWFKARPSPFYFAPPSASTNTQIEDLRSRLYAEFVRLAVAFDQSDLYAPPDLRAAYISNDGTVVRLYVTTSTNPYDTRSFDTIRQLRTLLAKPIDGAPGSYTAYVGGATAEFADVQDTISADFLRVAAITIVGILLVLILLLRALVAPLYLVVTVLLSYATSLSVSALILQNVFGQAGINYFIPLMVFVLLVALGSDYNIFLMSRVREESSTRDLRSGIRVASARTGTVITSAGLILAGTFGALVTSPLQLLFQVGLAVALGVLVDTFIVRSVLVPAITAFIGERAWWPFHRRSVK